MSLIAPTLEAFFTERLITQKDASPRTIAAYRDTLRAAVAIRSAADRQTAQPDWTSQDLDAPMIGAFLDHLEDERGNTPRPATLGWQRSTRSTGTPPAASRGHARRSRA